MTTADVPARLDTSVVAPMGLREVIEARLFVGPVGFDLAARGDSLDLEHQQAGQTLVLVDPPLPDMRAGAANRIDPDLALALRVAPPTSDDGLGELAVAVERTLDVHRSDRVDVLILHGADPFDHPAAVADRVLAALGTGAVGALGVTAHTVPQIRALLAHLPDDLRLALVGVDLDDVSIPSLVSGGLDLALELGTVPMVPFHRGLVLPGAPSVEADGLAVLLHHPSRPVVVVAHDDLAGRALLAEARSRHLAPDHIRRLLGAPT